jgi:hypothetical protein
MLYYVKSSREALLGRQRCNWDDNIERDLEEVGFKNGELYISGSR